MIYIELDEGICTLGEFDLVLFGQYGKTSILCTINIRIATRDNWLNKASSKYLDKSIKDLDFGLQLLQ